MNVSIGKHWEEFVEGLVQSGRYGSASEVMREGMRLLESREAKLRALKETIDASITEGGSYTVEEVKEYVRARRAERKAPRAAE